MGLGIKYTIDVDGKSGMNTLDLLNQKFNLLGDTAKTIGGKIQALFTFAAVEEAIRRTGEWAEAQDRLAISLGTTNEKVQAMNQLAMNANLDSGKVTGWFESLDAKRREAIKGNYDLRLSFQALGITFSELQHMNRSELFGKLMANKDVSKIVAGTPMGNALENLVGSGGIGQFQALQRAAGGQTLDQYTANGVANGSIVPGKDVTELSNQWIQIKQDLANALKNLAPLGKLLMALATILSESVLGFSRVFKHGFDIITGLINGDFTKVTSGIKGIGAVLLNAVFGIVKIFTGLVDIASKTVNNLIKKIPGVGKYAADETINYTKYVQEAQDFYNKKLGATRDDIRGGEGLGNLTAIVGTGGTGAAARMSAEGLIDLAGLAEKAGAARLSTTMLNNAVRLERLSQIGLGGGRLGMAGTMASWALGAVGQANQTPNNGVTANTEGGIDTPFNGTVPYQTPTRFTGESLSQLKLGGVFGSGIQSRMLRLSEQQTNYLSEIVKNTSFLAQYKPVGLATDNKKPSGGM
jgi:hypothetical protein